jgi:hypothetical protein
MVRTACGRGRVEDSCRQLVLYWCPKGATTFLKFGFDSFVSVRVISWIVSSHREQKYDPRIHTKVHELRTVPCTHSPEPNHLALLTNGLSRTQNRQGFAAQRSA